MAAEKSLMTLGLFQGTQVQMASSCIFQKTALLVTFSLVKQDQGKFSGSEGGKNPDMLIKSGSPPTPISR